MSVFAIYKYLMAQITKYSLLIACVVHLTGCVTALPAPVNMPTSKKKMCVGHECREMGAIDGGTTTRGHRDDPED